MPKSRGGTSYRLSDDAKDLLARLAGRLGLTKTGVLEMSIRKLARAEFGEVALGNGFQAIPKPRLSAELFARHHKN